MKIALLSSAIVHHDAIGTDIMHMYRILNQRHACHVHTEHLEDDTLQAVDLKELQHLAADPDNLLIYHHSISWPRMEPLLKQARARVVIKYHNITPPRFFRAYDAHLTAQCRQGRRQTRRLAGRKQGFLWMGDSLFNLRDAGVAGRPGTAVVPPFNNAEHWATVAPEPDLLRSLVESSDVNLLFVGRLAPNKGLDFLLAIVADHVQRYDRHIALHLVGKRDGTLAAFYDLMDGMVHIHGLDDVVHWHGEVDDAILLAYYLGSDFYMNCSQHEGFCVPIVEAQSLHLPILARRSG
ncbi:MAG: glycosyltransferase family 4 protein, partial [Acidobacteria bacterium]|nr:glycosyltransferase family 4 protein [Acidobacteriota bacterium]